MTVLIVDHGLCNLASVRRAFEECGGQVLVSEDPVALRNASHIVLPGIGTFAAGMQQLRERCWDIALREAHREGVPILGICLGMQLLAESGNEGGETEGLGLVPGSVVRMDPREAERLPHVGWNEVVLERENALFRAIPSGTDFYFVHSFHFVTKLDDVRIGTTPYCGAITTVIARGNTYGVQFHPEKSSKAGFQLIRNFLAT